jgi:hypothetical protein
LDVTKPPMNIRMKVAAAVRSAMRCSQWDGSVAFRGS